MLVFSNFLRRSSLTHVRINDRILISFSKGNAHDYFLNNFWWEEGLDVFHIFLGNPCKVGIPDIADIDLHFEDVGEND